MVRSTTITEVLNSWADLGVFAYALPFLMIFAIVFGILNKSEVLGKNRGVQATIALTVGLLALQFDYVSNFFATIFPYAGIGIAVILVLLILTGVFVSEGEKWPRYIWMAVGGITFIVIVMFSFNDFSYFFGGYVGQDAWKAILAGVVALGLLGWIIGSGSKK